MKFYFNLALLIAVIGFANAGTIETKPLSATKPKRFQLGSLIKSDEGDGVLLEHAGEPVQYEMSEKDKGTMLSKFISIGISPMEYRRTVVTLPLPEGFKGSDYSELVVDRPCRNIRFLAIEDLSTKDKIPEDTLIIISNDLKASILNEEVCKNLREKNAKLGFLKRFLPLEDQCRKTLVDCRVSFIENLDLPDDFDLMAAVKSTDKHYYGFKLLFAPFKNATMIYSDEKVEQRALVNLADLIMFEGDERLTKFCSEKGDDVINFSHNLVSDKFPVLPHVELPRFVMRDEKNKSNETDSSNYWIRFSGQSGTHLVAPYKYDKSKSNIGNLDDSFFFSPCIAISCPFGDAENYTVTRGHLEQWEKDKGRKIPENSAIFINTGFGSRWSSQPDKYVVGYPGIDVDALKWLVEERKCVAVGIDSLSLDDYSLSSENKWPGHGYCASKNIPVILNMNFVDNGADKFPEDGSRCVFSYLRIDRGTSSPIAVFGLPGYDKMELGGGSGQQSSKKQEGGEMKVESKQGEQKPSSLSSGGSSSKRWQFGHLIKNKADTCGDCSIRVADMNLFGAHTTTQKMMRFTEISLPVDPSMNKLTTYTQPSDSPRLEMKGCVETLFLKTTEIMSIRKKLQDVVKEETAVIFLTTDLMKLHDEGLIREAAAKRVCLGFFDDIELPSDVRDILLRYNLTFFENLRRPEGFNDDAIDENKLYYSFKFIFSPLAEGTSFGDTLKSPMDPLRKVNLADLVVYDVNDKEVVDRCAKKNLITLSHNWYPVEKVPITPNMSRPALIENGKKLMFIDHFGTHIDSPAHMDESNKMDIAHLSDSLDRPQCLRVDVPWGEQASFLITKQHLVDWESKSGIKIASKSMVFLVTGFGAKNWDNVDDYEQNFPGLSVDGAKFLVEERGVVAIGIDSLTIDVYSVVKSSTFPVHEYLSSKNVIVIENIGGDDLNKMTYDGSAYCALSYLRMEGATGSPVAVFGLLAETPKEVYPVEAAKPMGKGEGEGKQETTTKKAAASISTPGHLLVGLAVIAALFRGGF